MATKLFLRNTAANGIGNFFDMLAAAGSGSATGVVNTAASSTQIQWTRTAGGTVLEFISGRVPAGGFTLSGTMTFSIWAHESNAQANCAARARVFKRTAAGVETEIGGGPYNDGVEFGTSATEMSWTGAPTSTAFSEDDRIIVRFYITNIGTMGGSRTCTLTYNAADAATGDSFFQINENVAFKSETIVGNAGRADEADAAIGLGSARPAGLAAETDAGLALAAVQRLAAGLSLEGDVALALGAARPAGLSAEFDVTLALAGLASLPAGLSAENDVALALSAIQIAAVARSDEVDQAMALGVARPIAATAETDAPLALTAISILPVGAAAESDSALALTVTVALPAGLSAEAAEAVARGGVSIRLTGMAQEVEEVMALGSGRPAGISAEDDEALALDPGAPPGATGRSDEVDEALALLAVQIAPTGMAEEAGAALSLSIVQIRPAGLATEVDEAIELEAGSPGTVVGRSDESDATLALALIAIRSVGRSDETEEALALPARIALPTPPSRCIWLQRPPRATCGPARSSRRAASALQ